MIIRMKKLTLLSMLKDREAMLTRLRELGVVHIQLGEQPGSPEIDALHAQRTHAEHAHQAVAAMDAKHIPAPRPEVTTEIVEEINHLLAEQHKLHTHLTELKDQTQRQAPFGDFDPEGVRAIRERGLTFNFYTCDMKAELSAPEGATLIELGNDGIHRHLALTGPGGRVLEDASDFPLPDQSLATLHASIAETQRAIESKQEQLETFADCSEALSKHTHQLNDEIRFCEVQSGMESSGSVAYLSGYCPADRVADVEKAAEQNGWGLLVADPPDEDPVPTLIRRPAWVKPIKAVFEFIGVTPGYQEVDISALFLIFLSLFFGMIVGDAGYGALFLIGTLLGKAKMKSVPGGVWNLLLIMSVCTIIWGGITGNVFGILKVQETMGVSWLKDPDNMMALCFLLGATHLTIAHVWNAIRYINSLQALAQLGWIGTTWTMYFTAGSMVLGKTFPSFMMPVFILSVVMIGAFMTPWKRFKSEWFGHVMLPLDLVSNFVDVVSYVRLFAVGMATFALASAFNGMALENGVTGIVSGLSAALILFLGHALNIILAAMGVLVHGIRLNTLEFSGHLGLEWKGSPYAPFRRDSDKTD